MHIPVLAREVVAALAPAPGMVVVDATVGAGGHAAALLAHAGGPLLYLGLDQDAEILAIARERLAPWSGQVRLFHARFGELNQVAAAAGVAAADRVLFDLGVSSYALDRPERGFSIMAAGPLDMRMDRSRGPTAADLVATLPVAELDRILWEFGEERHHRRVARAIVRARAEAPILTTVRLAEIVARAVPRSPGIHPATRSFQALRIAANRELDQLGEGLEAAAAILRPGGRVAAISFHSLEDRLVKRFFRERLHPLVRRPIRPQAAEVAANRRARSARFRVAEKPGGAEAEP